LALSIRRTLLLFASASVAAGPVLAQDTASSISGYGLSASGGASSYGVATSSLPPVSANPTATAATSAATPAPAYAPTTPVPAIGFPAVATGGYASGSDLDALSTAITAARRGQSSAAQAAMAQIANPAARKLALWMIVDSTGESLPFFQLDQARRDLAGWPRVTRRQMVAEKALGGSGLGPAQTIAWFQGAEPITAQGAMALASAYQMSGRIADAQALIKHWWRDKVFDADTQRAMQARFGAYLTLDDHIKRADTLLYEQSPSGLSDIVALLPPDQVALVQARQALRGGSSDANARVAALPPALANSPSLAVDSARYLMARNLDDLALDMVRHFPSVLPNPDAASQVWVLRRKLIGTALKAHDYRAAYAAATNTGLTSGVDYTEAEFYAGWIALSKLHDPTDAAVHFANIAAASGTPITQARALYWSGRAAEAKGDMAAAQTFYSQGARFLTTFYGQLAAGKAGVQKIALGHDPIPTAADRARFEGREMVRAAKLAQQIGDKDLFRIFTLCLAEALPSVEEYAMLVDLARTSGDQDLAMRVVRLGAQHGYVLPDRGYPLRDAPNSPEAAEAAMVFGITRQESGFDPFVRSPAGARGMMQLMPATAAHVAKRLGESYGPGKLDDPAYNMRLGASYLGHMINDFSGSYVMAAAGYNAGPGRPLDWITYCGDPRSASVDPVDFIECIPFSETRNYVMRVMEATEVYRARLNGGSAPLNLYADLKRGGYLYQARANGAPTPPAVASAATASVIDAATPYQAAPGVTVQGAVR
jgi:soluble lytic murein transglycosylase